ncbi:MAG: bifunctional 5,10-methylenetetrahydrofolate dehydrogenase/5,10-methenyltetrahydrofolate cyclohydrolase [Anaerovoracaceae bacterium]
MEKLMKGKEVAAAIKADVLLQAENLKLKGVTPKLAIIRIGENPSDIAYEKGIISSCGSVGIETEIFEIPLENGISATGIAKNIEECKEQIIQTIQEINQSPEIHGVLIFRPFPKGINEKEISKYLSPEKDMDCFTQINVAKVMENDSYGYAPCTAEAVMEMLKYYKIPLAGKKAVVLGRSMVIGKPVAMMLLHEDATVTICHSKTQNLKELCREADILVVGVGHAKMVDKDFVRDGAVVVDVGINVDSNGKLWGDVDTDDCLKKDIKITPVPLGVGSVTSAILGRHLIRACMKLD